MAAISRSLVVFDLDGTVVDTMPATIRCFQEALASVLGHAPSRGEILEQMGPADQHIMAKWVGAEREQEVVRRLYQCYEREFSATGPFPGMLDLIRALRSRGRATALFTGRGRPSTQLILRTMGLTDLFDASVCGDEVPRSKPAPDGLLRLMNLLGRRPEETLYVGDAVMDMEAGHAAGVTPVAALWGSPHRERLEALDGVRTVRTVDELKELLLG